MPNNLGILMIGIKLNQKDMKLPHSWEHLNLTEIPINKAFSNIDKCLDYFEDNLDGFLFQILFFTTHTMLQIAV